MTKEEGTFDIDYNQGNPLSCIYVRLTTRHVGDCEYWNREKIARYGSQSGEPYVH